MQNMTALLEKRIKTHVRNRGVRMTGVHIRPLSESYIQIGYTASPTVTFRVSIILKHPMHKQIETHLQNRKSATL